MKNPNRIPTILEKLRVFWESSPDLRLGQVVMTLTTGALRRETPPRTVVCSEVFYVEDDVVEAVLDQELAGLGLSVPRPTKLATILECAKAEYRTRMADFEDILDSVESVNPNVTGSMYQRVIYASCEKNNCGGVKDEVLAFFMQVNGITEENRTLWGNQKVGRILEGFNKAIAKARELEK
jgi:hypothetical protein